jgi:hypothetical protein
MIQVELIAASGARVVVDNGLNIQFGDLATWITALGTVGAVIVALWLAGRDGRRRAVEERRHQAELITGWISGTYDMPTSGGRMTAPITINNASNQLAYRVIASVVRDSRSSGAGTGPAGDQYRVLLGELPPGRTVKRIEHPGGGMHFRAAIELAFRDAGGRC